MEKANGVDHGPDCRNWPMAARTSTLLPFPKSTFSPIEIGESAASTLLIEVEQINMWAFI